MVRGETITVEAIVKAPIAKVWDCWNEPEHISSWAVESQNWEVTFVENKLIVGGTFKIVTTTKDGSSSSDFVGTYVAIKNCQFIEYKFNNKRNVKVEFKEIKEGVKIIEIFDIEHDSPKRQQRIGWQSTLNNFKAYVEGES